MDTDLRLDLLTVIDHQGRECKQSGKSGGSGQYECRLEIKEDAISLTITLTLRESKFADFVA
jgi:hypothetical protein